VAIRVSTACSPASVGVVGKYKGHSSNKITAAREESMDSLVFFFIHIEPLESSELLRYLGQVALPPEPVIVAPYLESLVFCKWLSC